MNFKRNDLTISALKYASIIGVDKSDFVKMMEYKKVPSVKKGEYSLNEAIEAVEPFLKKREIKQKIHAFFINKGGVGKTLVSYNMAHYLALLGYRCLLIDLDPQTNLTNICGIDHEDIDTDGDAFEVLTESTPMSKCIIPIIKNVDLIKGSSNMGQIGAKLANKPGSDLVFFRKIANEGLRAKYDFIFFDNHSDHSKASNNAFIVSDSIISVANPDMFSYTGILPVLTSTIETSEALGREIKFHLLVNNFELNQPIQNNMVKKFIEEFKPYIFSNFIKRSSDFNKATVERKPFYCFSANNSNAIKDYAGLLEEFLKISSDEAITNEVEEVTHG